MAFDITPYIDKKPGEIRKLIREGVIDFPTAGMCRGYAQANLIILPPEYAGDFEEFAKRNPFPCPILEIIRGTPETHDIGEGGNICTDIPKYRIYRDGKWDGKELTSAVIANRERPGFPEAGVARSLPCGRSWRVLRLGYHRELVA